MVVVVEEGEEVVEEEQQQWMDGGGWSWRLRLMARLTEPAIDATLGGERRPRTTLSVSPVGTATAGAAVTRRLEPSDADRARGLGACGL